MKLKDRLAVITGAASRMVRKLDLLEFTLADGGWAIMTNVMPRVLDPFRFLSVAVAGWMNQRQLQIIDYLREENRVLIEQLGGRRVRFNDDQRRRLAAKAEGLGRRILTEVATIVIPETAPSERRRCGTSENGMAHMISSDLRVGEVASTR
jgi:hypothetical protein